MTFDLEVLRSIVLQRENGESCYFRLHFPYVSSILNTKLFTTALGHTFNFPGEGFIGYGFGEPAPNVPFALGPSKLPTLFSVLPIWNAHAHEGTSQILTLYRSCVYHGSLVLSFSARPNFAAAKQVSFATLSRMLKSHNHRSGAHLGQIKQPAFFEAFQKVADELYTDKGNYGFYCTTTNPTLKLMDPEKAAAGYHMEKLVNVNCLETMDAFQAALPKIQELTAQTEGAYVPSDKYEKDPPSGSDLGAD
jgi:hypothetical protein